MLKPLFAVLATVLAALAPSVISASQESGSIVLIGGVLRYDNSPVWERIVALAGGVNSEFVVLPTATGRARQYGGFAVRALQRHGASAELLPVAFDTAEFGVDYREAVRDAELLAKVRNADGVFFTGGAPQRIAQTLYSADGIDTPLLAAIRDVFSAGGVVAGANAGTAVISTGISALPALQAGLPDNAIQRGLGLLKDHWFVDQHLFTHGRFAASLVAMRQLGIQYGLGVGVNAAVIVTGAKQAEVIGANGVLLIDLSEATFNDRQPPFQLTGGRISYLGNGDRLDLGTRRIVPHASKLMGFEIDPNAPDRQPAFAGTSFYSDIFAESALVNLIISAVDGIAREGTGLALAQGSARDETGFRFRFYPGMNSFGWFSIDSNYTVSTIYLDVMPAANNELIRMVRRNEAGRQ